MAKIYIVTGKLGAGKTLCAVGKIQEYLLQARPVATNLDINLHKMIGKDKKNTRLYRLPDHPSVSDLKCLGRAYTGDYDEDKTGLMVFDECATWLNARDWKDKGRQEMLDYLLHIRKRGWDVIFILQDVSMLDKQFRKALAEHVVYCRRMDRVKMTMPLIGWIIEPFLAPILTPLKKRLKWHVAIVKYGDSLQSLTVDRWFFMGRDLYPAYETTQIFKHDPLSAVHSVLPPHYIFRNSFAQRNKAFYMRLTKIYARKYSRIFIFLAGATLVTLLNLFIYQFHIKNDIQETQSISSSIETADSSNTDKNEKEPEDLVLDTLEYKYKDLYITGSVLKTDSKGRKNFYYHFTDDEYSYDTDYFKVRDIKVIAYKACKALFKSDDEEFYVYCGGSKLQDLKQEVAVVQN